MNKGLNLEWWEKEHPKKNVCENCGSEIVIQKHHTYNKKKPIQKLCRDCHFKTHSVNKEIADITANQYNKYKNMEMV